MRQVIINSSSMFLFVMPCVLRHNPEFFFPCCLFRPGVVPPLLEQKHDPHVEVSPVVQCTNHMCPIHIHWHVKVNYKKYWRVKITATNLNTMRNYSDWNLVVLHPNLNNVTQVFSFNYKPMTPLHKSISK